MFWKHVNESSLKLQQKRKHATESKTYKLNQYVKEITYDITLTVKNLSSK
jgi:hypothetical protein